MTSPVRLAPAHAGDAPRIAVLSRDLVEHGLGWQWRSARVAASIRDPDTEVVVARRDGAVVGFAIGQFVFANRTLHLALLAVAPDCRRIGLGRRLFGWIEKMAVLGGIESFVLEVRERNRGARAFYRRLGFEEASRLSRYYEGREDALRLVARAARR